MNLQPIWMRIADLNGMLVAIERSRASWAEFEAELGHLIAWLWEQAESGLRDDLLEELRWTAEHAQKRRHDRVRDSLRRAAAHLA